MDREILKKLFELYSHEIYHYLYSLCKDSGMAEELMQETFVKALISLNEQHINMRAWLYMVARNLCFNELKRAKREVLLAAVDNTQKHGQDILEHVLQGENKKILQRGMEKLAPDKRRVLQMYYIEGFSLKEIAKILGLSQANTRILSYRAKRELRMYFEEVGYEI